MHSASLSKSCVLLATTSVAVGAVGFYLYRKRKSTPPAQWEEVGTVTELYMYPLKSGKRIPVKRAECTKRGLRQTAEDGKIYQLRDRELVVFDAKTHAFVTGRNYPKMVLIEVGVHDDQHFAINAVGMETLYVKRPKPGEAKGFDIKGFWNETLYALDCGEEAARWLSKHLMDKDEGVRLGYYDGVFQRNIEKAHKAYLKFYKNFKNDAAGIFSDISCGHIINETSVHDLNERVKTTSITVRNFRPTIVVNCPPYSEDDWNWVKVGEVIFQVIQPCTRCVMTTIDPETGIKDENAEPLKTLRTYKAVADPELRKLEKYAPIMGTMVGAKKLGFVNVGDKVYVGKV